MAAPTFISITQTVWNDTISPKTTSSISIETGDVLVALAATSSWQIGDLQTNNPTISDSLSLTWTKHQEIAQDQYCGMVAWSATAPSNTTFTVTFTHVHTNTAIYNGGLVLVFRASSGVGSSNNGYGNLVIPQINLTPNYTQASVVFFSADWNTNTNTNREWLSVNDYTPTSGNGYELVYNVAGNYTIYCAYWPNVGTNQSYTFGLNNTPIVLQKSSQVAIEVIRGSSDLSPDGSGAVTPGVSGIENATSITNITSITI